MTLHQIELPITNEARRPRQQLPTAPRAANGATTRWTLDCRQVERARVVANMTYQQLAAAARVDRATLSDMLNGRRRSTLGSVHAVIRALNLDPAVVLLFK
jgi:hypothetical protein